MIKRAKKLSKEVKGGQQVEMEEDREEMNNEKKVERRKIVKTEEDGEEDMMQEKTGEIVRIET